MTLLLKQAEFAARHGVVASAVSNWKKRGLLVFAEDPARPGKQMIDAEKSDLLIKGTIDPTRGRPRNDATQAAQSGAAPAEGQSRAVIPMNGLEAARLEEMRERTTRRKIENEQLLGRLVPLSEYERRAGEMGRVIRERTHGLIRQHGERLAAETDPRTIMALLGQAFDALFDQVADEIEAAASDERVADAALAQIEAADSDDDDDEGVEATG